MRGRGRLILVFFLCSVLVVAGAVYVAPGLLLVFRSFSYVFGAVEPTGGPYDNVAFGSEGPGELRGGPGNDLLASEGPWGQYPEVPPAPPLRRPGRRLPRCGELALSFRRRGALWPR